MFQEKVYLPTPLGELVGIWSWPKMGFKGITLITSHGLLSHKGTSKYRLLAQRFCQEGFGVFSFDYSGCGESCGDLKENTVSKRIKDLEMVLEYVKGKEEVNSIFLMGSSMGGYVSLHVSSRRRDIKGLVTWASPWDLSFFLADEAYHFQELGPSFYQELKEGRFVRSPSVKNLLVIHGLMDEVIPPSHAERIHYQALNPKRLELIKGADHRFSKDEHREKAVNFTLQWVLEYS